jgi:hypothetical protein
MGRLQIFQRHIPTKIKVKYPPGLGHVWGHSCTQCF